MYICMYVYRSRSVDGILQCICLCCCAVAAGTPTQWRRKRPSLNRGGVLCAPQWRSGRDSLSLSRSTRQGQRSTSAEYWSRISSLKLLRLLLKECVSVFNVLLCMCVCMYLLRWYRMRENIYVLGIFWLNGGSCVFVSKCVCVCVRESHSHSLPHSLSLTLTLTLIRTPSLSLSLTSVRTKPYRFHLHC